MHLKLLSSVQQPPGNIPLPQTIHYDMLESGVQMRRLKKASVIVVLSLVVLFMGGGGLHLSPVEIAASPYLYDLMTWEVSNLPDKWVHKLWSLLPWNSRSRQERLDELQEFFRIGQEIRELERSLVDIKARTSPDARETGSPGTTYRSEMVEDLQIRLDDARSRASNIRAGVEETLESEVSAVLADEGFSSRIGLIFPVVDVALSSPPRLLVISLRDRIEWEQTVLLKPDMKVEDMEVLEEKILREQGLSALVTNIGGLATYPTIVRSNSSLRHAAATAAHEWLHTYWFFRPLGWNILSSSRMNTLNETAADLAGRELGERAYESITGQKPETSPQSTSTTEEPDEDAFDFSKEMRKTRLRVDELLASGKVEDAEAYMEERRLLFVDNGFRIRKLNQAYFAFHGTYAASPASVSPIGGEVELLRDATDSLGNFIRTMAGFGSYREFQDYLRTLSESTAPQRHSRQAINFVETATHLPGR